MTPPAPGRHHHKVDLRDLRGSALYLSPSSPASEAGMPGRGKVGGNSVREVQKLVTPLFLMVTSLPEEGLA